MADYPFLKGHGTENDFVLLPDHDGSVHGDLPAARVRALCDRRAGIGADGVLRVVRVRGAGESSPSRPAPRGSWTTATPTAAPRRCAATGSGSSPCTSPRRASSTRRRRCAIATRDGIKTVTIDGDAITVDLGSPRDLGETEVGVDGRTWTARHVDMGNPHAVAFVDDLADAGRLLDAPSYDTATYPHGVNVEFVARRGEGHVAMRVHERGVGETRSCGTGAGAVLVATALADGYAGGADTSYTVDVPGGRLRLTWTADDRVLLTGPAVVVARGTTSL